MVGGIAGGGMARLSIEHYNYRAFSLEAHEGLDTFAQSPEPGSRVDDFPLTTLDGAGTGLRALCGEHHLTIVEFGSIT